MVKEYSIRAVVLLNLSNLLRKRDLFPPTRLINSIEYEHSCKILDITCISYSSLLIGSLFSKLLALTFFILDIGRQVLWQTALGDISSVSALFDKQKQSAGAEIYHFI